MLFFGSWAICTQKMLSQSDLIDREEIDRFN
jgi:hypothetical protein